jgi:hypothetical protein
MESSATAGVFLCVVRRTSTLSPKFIIFRSKGTRIMVMDYVTGQTTATWGSVNQLTSRQMCGISVQAKPRRAEAAGARRLALSSHGVPRHALARSRH